MPTELSSPICLRGKRVRGKLRSHGRYTSWSILNYDTCIVHHIKQKLKIKTCLKRLWSLLCRKSLTHLTASRCCWAATTQNISFSQSSHIFVITADFSFLAGEHIFFRSETINFYFRKMFHIFSKWKIICTASFTVPKQTAEQIKLSWSCARHCAVSL